MKLITWNVNGLRAVERKEMLNPFLEREKPDVFFMNETKCQPAQAEPFAGLYPEYVQHYHSAEKKGYSGVAVWVRQGIDHSVTTGMPGWNDHEGRIIRVDIGDLSVLGGYFPNGGKSPEAWEEKLEFYAHFLGYVNDLRDSGKQVFWGGDINVAHNEIDLARPKSNEGKVGFHPRERAWCDACLAASWSDIWRAANPNEIVYSWWHFRSGARSRNVGWRIDSWWADESEKAVAEYLPDVLGSDHCPVVLTLKPLA